MQAGQLQMWVGRGPGGATRETWASAPWGGRGPEAAREANQP